MEQLINGIDGIIKTNSGKSLHQETQQADKTNKAWYLASVFLIGLAVLAVFYIKGKHHQAITQKAVLKNSKTLVIRITKKMITTAPNRLTPNNPE
ncbi:flagellar basal body rod protein FlgG [Helicobacter pylori Hp H-21]|nr:flagellar basal body rod protein FlgG [Helicobacter pylori Hp H-21]